MLDFTGLVVSEGDGFFSLCPELDVASQGDTIRAAKEMLREALTGYLETCFESNLPYLRTTPDDDDPRRTEPENVALVFSLRVDLSAKVHG